MVNKSQVKRTDNSDDVRKVNKKNKLLGYAVLYFVVLCIIIVGEIILFKMDPNASLVDLFKDMIGNLMGVLAAFLVFDIAHEKISKDTYAMEVSEQILETLMYNPEVIDLYESEQKKVFIHSFINGHLGCFYILATVNSTTTNIGVSFQISVPVASRYTAEVELPRVVPFLVS